MGEPFLWWRDGVIYQIYPRSFCDSNDDGFGDLNGITSRLDYLAGLGIDAIWLSPIYPSPDADFGYDVSDYTAIDPRYGSMEDFDRLLSEAHSRGLRIILDLVLNHTSDQHAWFQSARSGRQSPMRDWYLWQDPAPDGGAPNNWRSRFGGSGWEYDSPSGQYYFHMFLKQQPDLNWRNPAVRASLLDVFRFWLEKGVDGFRLDVFNAYFKDAHFRSNPAKLGLLNWDRQQHIYDFDQPEMLPLLQEIRTLVDRYPDRYLVGETFESTSQRAAQYTGPDRLHATFNFDFSACRWRASCFQKSILDWEHALQVEDWPNYVLSNHDMPRAASRYGQGEDDQRMKVAATLLLTQRGTPYLYYGEEIGLRDVIQSRSEIQDPPSRRYWPFFNREGCRAPMQWDISEQAGFSRAEPWMRVHKDYLSRNVASQQAQPDSLYNHFRRLIQLRKEMAGLREGMTLPLIYEPRSLMAYLRKTREETFMVVLNFRRYSNRFALGGMLSGPQWELLNSSRGRPLQLVKNRSIQLAANEALILRQR